MEQSEHSFVREGGMTARDFEKEADQNIEDAAAHESELPEAIRRGIGVEEWNYLYKKDPEFASFLERFPDIVELFGLLAAHEVVKGEIKMHPEHLELLKKLFVFYEQHKGLIERVAQELKSSALEKLKREQEERTRYPDTL